MSLILHTFFSLTRTHTLSFQPAGSTSHPGETFCLLPVQQNKSFLKICTYCLNPSAVFLWGFCWCCTESSICPLNFSFLLSPYLSLLCECSLLLSDTALIFCHLHSWEFRQWKLVLTDLRLACLNKQLSWSPRIIWMGLDSSPLR